MDSGCLQPQPADKGSSNLYLMTLCLYLIPKNEQEGSFMSGKKSLLETIREKLRNGELPDSFSLPQDDSKDPNKIKWADGALDGVGIYHMGAPTITDAHTQLIADAFATVRDHQEAAEIMKRLFEMIPPVRAIDAIQNYIFDHADALPPESVYAFARNCLNSADVNLVKLGLIIIEIFNEPDNAVKDIIRTLGLSDEFTIFSVFNMMRWTNGNSEVFRLAQKVHGWGRIHAVERLRPETQEIRDWLLEEGIRNDVLPAYSALDVYQKADIAALLKTNITDHQMNLIACVLNAMFDEGPVKGISALPETEAAEMLSNYLDQAAAHEKTLAVCELILAILNDERFQQYAERCRAILNGFGCRILIEKELERGRGVNLAKAVGIPYAEKILTHMSADFENGYFNCIYLLGDEQYREQVLDIFRTSLPLQSMTGEPTSDNGWGKKNADYGKLTHLLQHIAEYPLCGTDLVIAGLHMPVVPCRSQAVRTASCWCKAKECALSALSEELFQAVEALKAAEVDDRVKKCITESGF